MTTDGANPGSRQQHQCTALPHATASTPLLAPNSEPLSMQASWLHCSGQCGITAAHPGGEGLLCTQLAVQALIQHKLGHIPLLPTLPEAKHEPILIISRVFKTLPTLPEAKHEPLPKNCALPSTHAVVWLATAQQVSSYASQVL